MQRAKPPPDLNNYGSYSLLKSQNKLNHILAIIKNRRINGKISSRRR
jgi:hypothetical protein